MDSAKREELLSKLKEIVKNEIRFSLVKQDAPLDVRASRFGGMPAVPADFEWPRFSYRKGRKNGKRISWSSIFFPSKKKRIEEGSCESEPQKKEAIGDPLSFLAQINLKDVAALDEDNLLPKSGTLCSFYTIGETWSGRDPKEKGCARVFYFPEVSALTFAVPPNDLNEDFLIPEYALEFKRRPSLPVFDAYERYVDFDDEDDEVDSDFTKSVSTNSVWEKTMMKSVSNYWVTRTSSRIRWRRIANTLRAVSTLWSVFPVSIRKKNWK